MNEHLTPTSSSLNIAPLADRAAEQADRAIDATQRAANNTLDTLHDKVSSLRTAVPALVSDAAASLGELTQKGLHRARQTTADARERANLVGQNTRAYIRDEPVKSVLVAAAAGAVLATVLAMVARSRNARRA